MIADVEAECRNACQAIESGNWQLAYEICDRLCREPGLPAQLVHDAMIVRAIVNPANTRKETVDRIAQLLPGRVIRIYDDDQG